MKLITWNVNSIRTRIERVLALLQRHDPDLLCLQETKVTDDEFPRVDIEALGYRCTTYGQRTYNGVALICKQLPEQVQRGFPDDPIPDQARVIAAQVSGVRVINLYVVNGQAVGSDKYDMKLSWLAALTRWLQASFRPTDALVIVGDFNIAPDDRDVHDPHAWRDRILCSVPERDALHRMMAWGLQDVLRLHTTESGIFSWWDYRAGAFPRNLGLRIDLALATESLAKRCYRVAIDRDERKSTTGPGKPSDHAPVIVEFS